MAPLPKYPDDYVGLREGLSSSPRALAWYASHHHTCGRPERAVPKYSYLFAYAMDVPAGSKDTDTTEQ